MRRPAARIFQPLVAGGDIVNPSEVRQRILAEHRTIRGMLLGIETLAEEVLANQPQRLEPLCEKTEALLAELLNHMSWEDLHLRPALLAADAWGRERAALLDRDHAEQRQLLESKLEHLRDPARPPLLIARDLLELVKLLRDDMEREEELLLDPRVLRDDVVGIDVETG
jgi:iron-sulfur cluster repair protein YtfE (RIC family)